MPGDRGERQAPANESVLDPELPSEEHALTTASWSHSECSVTLGVLVIFVQYTGRATRGSNLAVLTCNEVPPGLSLPVPAPTSS